MSKLAAIPIVVESGQKYKTAQGFSAIKDGVKAETETRERLPKPAWLRISNQVTPAYLAVKEQVETHKLATVCQEAKCPNLAECWSHGTATIMLMGKVCTRACRFCAVDTGNPQGWLDLEEPNNAAKTVALMNLDYVVLTSVNRDDLPDGGAAHYAAAISAIRERSPNTKIEALTPDFQGVTASIETLLDLRQCQVDILTLGQYMQPTKHHLPVQRYLPPEEFTALREIGLEKGFFEVAAGPLVRSSYRADRIFKRDNLGL